MGDTDHGLDVERLVERFDIAIGRLVLCGRTGVADECDLGFVEVVKVVL